MYYSGCRRAEVSKEHPKVVLSHLQRLREVYHVINVGFKHLLYWFLHLLLQSSPAVLSCWFVTTAYVLSFACNPSFAAAASSETIHFPQSKIVTFANEKTHYCEESFDFGFSIVDSAIGPFYYCRAEISCSNKSLQAIKYTVWISGFVRFSKPD